MRIYFHKITAGPFQENGYIVYNDKNKECFIIDPGDAPNNYIKTIKDNDLIPVGIVNTHGHIDHVHAVQPLKDHFLIPFYIHQNEKMYVDHYPEGCLMYGMTPNKKPEVDYWISDSENISIGEFMIKIVQTPGHTLGGICLQLNGDIFTGDTLFKGSIGRTDLPGGNYTTLMDSLKNIIEQVDGDTKVHPGHGYSTTINDEMQTNPFLNGLK